jgi:hypothetical protein
MSQQKAKTDNHRPRVMQTVKVVSRTIYCIRCNEEMASYYCPCGAFMCTLDFISHNCTNTLKEMYHRELVNALR